MVNRYFYGPLPMPEQKEVRIPYVWSDGMFTTHDQACAICCLKPAVWHCNLGWFSPCWSCQERGYLTIRVPKWARKFADRFVK